MSYKVNASICYLLLLKNIWHIITYLNYMKLHCSQQKRAFSDATTYIHHFLSFIKPGN